MFGIGIQELIVLLVILGMLAASVVILVGLFVYVQRSRNKGVSGNPNLRSCPDCGGTVSQLAPSCPHCGRPTSASS